MTSQHTAAIILCAIACACVFCISLYMADMAIATPQVHHARHVNWFPDCDRELWYTINWYHRDYFKMMYQSEVAQYCP